MVASEVCPGSRHECCEAGDEVCGVEEDVGGAVAEGVFELIDDLAGGIDREAVEAEGRARDVPAQLLEPVTLMGLAGDGTGLADQRPSAA